MWQAAEPVLDAMQGAFEDFAKVTAEGIAELAPIFASIVKELAPMLELLAKMYAMVGTGFLKFMFSQVKAIALVIDYAARVLRELWDMWKKFLETLGWKDEPKKMLDKMGSPHQSLMPRVGGFENLENTWERIQRSVFMVTGVTGKPTEEKQLDELQAIRAATEGTRDQVG